MAIAAGTLMSFEILLTRLASLRYHFHFGHLAVSNGLLGIGASASWLGLTRERWREKPDEWLENSLFAYLASLCIATLILYTLPVHLGPMDLTGTLSFAAFAVASLLPFLTGGCVIGLILSAWPKSVAKLYGTDLLAAGLGCLLIPLSLPTIGASGALAIIIVLSGFASLLGGSTYRLASLALMGTVLAAASLTPEAPSKITRPILSSQWTPLSRVDIVEVSPANRTIRATGRPVPAASIPPQVEIMQDGSASTLLTDFSSQPDARQFLDEALYSAATQLQTDPDLLVIGFGGGDDVWATLGAGAASVTAVDLHEPVLGAHTQFRPQWSRGILNNPNVELRVAEGRSTLMRTTRQFDVVQLTGIDTWAALSSGAYMLAENHLYTTEAFDEMLDRVRPGGILQITRMAAEMETLRVLVQLRTALADRSPLPFSECVMVIGSIDHQVATLTKPDGFSPQQILKLTSWATDAGFRLHYAPGSTDTGLISTFIRTPNPSGFIDAFPRNIQPTYDDSPYFFQFTRWTRPDLAMMTIREPTYISQGNPLWIAGLGLYTVLMAVLLLYGPFILSARRPGTGQPTRYFAGLGMGYVMIELGLMHKLTLLLGHPMLSFSVVLAGMLLASGVGSLLSERTQSVRWIAPALLAWALSVHWGVPELTSVAQSWDGWLRICAALAITAPVGLILGIPMAHGLARIPAEEVPWAWATNALFSVMGAIAVIVVSMTLTFSSVLAAGTAVYFISLRTPLGDPSQ